MTRRLLALFALICFTLPAIAAEPLPGDACAAANNLQFTSGPEVSGGGGHAMLCQGGTWKSILSFNSAAGLTKLGNQTCTTNEILKFNGTTWACAADAAGSGGVTALTGEVTASGTGSVAATIANNAITNAKMADAAIGIVELSATGTASATTYLRGDNTWASISGGDNLGSHTATTNIQLGSNWLSGDGGNEGINVSSNGLVGIGTSTPGTALDVVGSNNNNDEGVTVRTYNSNSGADAWAGFRIDNDIGDVGYLWSGSSAYGAAPYRSRLLLEAGSNATGVTLRTTYAGQNIVFETPNVGIGEPSPVDRLHVAGQIRIDNNNNTTNKGCIRYDGTGNKLQFSHDCTIFTEMSGSSADNLGNHTATQALNMGGFGISSVAAISSNGTILTTSATGVVIQNVADSYLTVKETTSNDGFIAGTDTDWPGSFVFRAIDNSVVGGSPVARISQTGTVTATGFIGDGSGLTGITAPSDNLGAGGSTTGTLLTKNASGYGYVGSAIGTTGGYMRFDDSPTASAGRIYTNLLGTWEYVLHPDYFGPYVTNVNDLGISAVRWKDGWFAGDVTAGSFSGAGTNLTALNATNLGSGTVAAARMPALTGDVTMIAGTTVTAIAANAVTTAEIAADTIVAGDIATGGVATAEILDNTIAAADIAPDAITASELATSAVTTTEILDSTITTTDIAADTIAAVDIATDAIGTLELAVDAVGIANISATGTPSNTTFLRGDNTWSAAGGGVNAQTTASSTMTCPFLCSGSVNCPATYFRSGCSVGGAGSNPSSAPNGTNGCDCGGGSAGTCYAICVK